MSINYDEKIEKINSDRILMLQTVKELIVKDNNLISDDVENTIYFLNIDTENINEYDAIIKAKDLILDLVMEISMATSIEDIVKLRNKINYQINKVKKEIAKRNISPVTFEQFYNKVTELRKNISMYLRFLKRESTLIEIRELYDRLDYLSDEDRMRLKKLLANELKYNKRVLISMNSNSECTLEDEPAIVKKVNDDEIQFVAPIKEEKNTDKDEFLESFIKQMSDVFVSNPLNRDNALSDEDYLKNRIGYYSGQYNFYKLFNYNHNFLRNCISFLGNIPKYICNKNIIKMAKKDYYMFYQGEDFGGFIDYSKKRNSIKVALQAIFRSSHLSQREIECLYNHENCMQWIMEFYNYKCNVSNDGMVLVRTK